MRGKLDGEKRIWIVKEREREKEREIRWEGKREINRESE